MRQAPDPKRLIEELRNGSEAAFESFYERYVPLVYRIAFKLTGDRMEAEDICHDVFVELMRHPEKYDPSRGSVEAFLAVKAKSKAFDRLRKRKRWLPASCGTAESRLREMEAEGSVEEVAMAGWQRDRLLRALARIPQAQRAAVYGMFIENMTQQQLAEAMNRPLGTVKSLIRYGLRRLREELGAERKDR